MTIRKAKKSMFSEDNMYSFVESAAVSRNLVQTIHALPFMKECHEGQFRRGKDNRK